MKVLHHVNKKKRSPKVEAAACSLGVSDKLPVRSLKLESGVKATSSGLERLQALDLAEYVVDEVA